MSVVVITGSAGLVGSEAARFFCQSGDAVVGIDNDMRSYYFGPEASTAWKKEWLQNHYPNYTHRDIDIRNEKALENLFREYGSDIKLIVHAAAQPSHDWAAREPYTDFQVNANGTLHLLENTRRFCPDAVFIYTSTNKVYGDRPNELPLVERETRWEIAESHQYRDGIDESMSVDVTKHSLFGASKLAADILVQEYGRYFGLRTGCFRGGCLTGPDHSGSRWHGFLSYLMKCVITDQPYTVYGYLGKQVRDNIHSQDLVRAFYLFSQAPRPGEVYNIGGGRFSNCSMLEAITLCEEIAQRKLNWTYSEANRSGDHIWWISDTKKFQTHYPAWSLQHDLRSILRQIFESNTARWV